MTRGKTVTSVVILMCNLFYWYIFTSEELLTRIGGVRKGVFTPMLISQCSVVDCGLNIT